MPQDDQTKSYLWDIRQASLDIAEFLYKVKFHHFEKNKMLRSAVERQLLIIGEAAVHISPQFRKKHPEIGWKKLVELRNVIAHEYGETLISRIWVAAKEELPAILEPLNKLTEE